MVDKTSGVGPNSNVPPVNSKKSDTKAENNGTTTTNNTGNTKENNLAALDASDSTKTNFDKLIEDGTLTRQKILFGLMDSDYYDYLCDGKKTLGEIKKELGLGDGVLRKRNSELMNNLSNGVDKTKDHYLDDIVPSKGTKLTISNTDFPVQEVTFTDNQGNSIHGFKKAIDGTLYYSVQDGDTISFLKDLFKAKSFKDYNMGAVITQLQESEGQTWQNKPAGILAVGTEATVPKKNLWQKIFG